MATKFTKTLDIGEVSALSGLRPSTLRFYEDKKLILPAGRRGLRRFYGRDVLERLEFIALGRAAGFSLDEIGGMIQADGRLQVNRGTLRRKADDLERSIKRMKLVQRTLRHVASCPARNHFECAKFVRLLRLAGKLSHRSRNQAF